MVEFTAKIAGYAIAFRALYPQTKTVFERYLTQEEPVLSIAADEEAIRSERRLLENCGQKEIRFPDGLTDSQVESNFLYREVAERLSEYGAVLLHGSAVAADGEGYVFAAPSGTGKSTHTRLWMELLRQRAVMINDDKPILRCTEKGVLVCGSPWDGKHHLSCNRCVPLKAICFLERGKENRIENLSGEAAFMRLLQAVYHSKTASRESNILQSLQHLRQNIAFYRLWCNVEPDAARVSFEAMRLGADCHNR